LFNLAKYAQHNPKSGLYLGVIFALVAAIFVGSVNVVGKMLVAPEHAVNAVNPINIIVISGLIAGMMFTPIVPKNEPLKILGSKTLFLIILMGFADILAVILTFYGLQHTSAVNASILGDTEIVFSVLIAVIIFQERLKKEKFFHLS
jgi:drug/metabolite transporter (DMT)-like permease